MADINSPEYTAFMKRRGLWIECLSGEDRNSIMRQIHGMIWDAATFHVVNEARRLARPKKGGRVQLGGLVHGLIDKGFLASQTLALRRLADKNALQGKKGVYSLVALLRDMGANAHLLTRAHLLAAEDLPMEGQAALHCALEDQTATASGPRDPRMDDDLALMRMEELHEAMDWLAGVDEKTRTWQDAARKGVFLLLEDKVMKACADAKMYVDKFVAHAATPDSRQEVNADGIAITLAHLGEAHETICKIANLIDMHLLTGSGHNFLPVPQYNQFEYIDRPLVSGRGLRRLCEVWRKYARETDKWGQGGLDEFESEFGG